MDQSQPQGATSQPWPVSLPPAATQTTARPSSVDVLGAALSHTYTTTGIMLRLAAAFALTMGGCVLAELLMTYIRDVPH